MKPITAAVLTGLMRRYSDSVNMVNAPHLARERGMDVREVRHDREGDYHTLIRVTVATSQGDRSVAGTLFSNNDPRLVEMFGIQVEADLAGDMLYIVNEDAPRSEEHTSEPQSPMRLSYACFFFKKKKTKQ